MVEFPLKVEDFTFMKLAIICCMTMKDMNENYAIFHDALHKLKDDHIFTLNPSITDFVENIYPPIKPTFY